MKKTSAFDEKVFEYMKKTSAFDDAIDKCRAKTAKSEANTPKFDGVKHQKAR